MAFPIEDSMHIMYFSDDVSQAQVDRRMAGYCTRIGHPDTKARKAPEAAQANLADDTRRAAMSVWYDCD